MSGLRGFGMVMQVGGPVRHWYADADGIRRWADDHTAVDAIADFYAAMSVGIPPLGTPDPISELEASEGLVGLQSSNTDIDVSESSFYPLTDAQIEEGHQTEIRR